MKIVGYNNIESQPYSLSTSTGFDTPQITQPSVHGLNNIVGDIDGLHTKIKQTNDEIVLKASMDDDDKAEVVVSSINNGTVTIKGELIDIEGNTTFTDLQDKVGEGVNRTFRQDDEPDDGMREGDLWIDTDDGDAPYTYDGDNWIRAYTRIDGGYITTGTVDADRIDVKNIYIGDLDKAGALAEKDSAGSDDVDFNYADSSSKGGNAKDTDKVDGEDASNVKSGALKANDGLNDDGKVKLVIEGANLPTDAPADGLAINKDYMGYYSDSEWKTYIKNDGQFYFKGDDDNYIQWDGNTMTVQGDMQTIDGDKKTYLQGGEISFKVGDNDAGAIYGKNIDGKDVIYVDSILAVQEQTAFGNDAIIYNNDYSLKFKDGDNYAKINYSDSKLKSDTTITTTGHIEATGTGSVLYGATIDDGENLVMNTDSDLIMNNGDKSGKLHFDNDQDEFQFDKPVNCTQGVGGIRGAFRGSGVFLDDGVYIRFNGKKLERDGDDLKWDGKVIQTA